VLAVIARSKVSNKTLFALVANLLSCACWEQGNQAPMTALPMCADVTPDATETDRPSDDFFSHYDSLAKLHIEALGVPSLPKHNQAQIPIVPASRSLDDLWKADSIESEWMLADFATTTELSSRETARRAARVYRVYSGRAGPILYFADQIESIGNLDLGLFAISDSLIRNQEEIVYRLACDAGWLLQSYQSDTVFASRSRLRWINQAGRIIAEAKRISRGHRKDEIEALATLLNMHPVNTMTSGLE
jgi:hypothetical protein